MNSIYDYAERDDLLMEKKVVFFVSRLETSDDGQFIPLMAFEGVRGYQKTDWLWGKDYEIANLCCDERNQKSGIDKIEAIKIQLQSMSPEPLI